MPVGVSLLVRPAAGLVPEKGVDLLMAAAAKLPGVWRLHIAGEGPQRIPLEELAHDSRNHRPGLF